MNMYGNFFQPLRLLSLFEFLGVDVIWICISWYIFLFKYKLAGFLIFRAWGGISRTNHLKYFSTYYYYKLVDFVVGVTTVILIF